jgi:ABC-type multidrug transport system ATPase subunit
LKGISGIFKAGKCTAIMGASGAGKTTLLNILACRISPDKGGKLYANTLEYDYEQFGDFANYVMQNDVLMQTLTVRETL